MAFASGSVTFRRYRVVQCGFKVVDEAFIDALNGCAFGRYRTVEEGVDLGWVTPAHLFDVDFAGEKIAAGRFAHFRLRRDRTTVPAGILRSYVEIERLAALEASGREFLTREERRQAKEAAQARADKEARSGAFRRIAAYPVLFDLDQQMLYFGNTSAAANDALRTLFADTFDAELMPAGAHEQAYALVGTNGHARELEDARPAHLVATPEGVDGAYYSSDPADRAFLGREFLSWLWYQVDVAEGLIKTPRRQGALARAEDEIATAIASVAHLRCDFNLTGTDVIRSDAPSSSPEGRSALAVGKQPSKLGLILGGSSGEWTFVLDGARLDVSGLALTPVEEEDAHARLEARFEGVAELGSVIDGLFAAFLEVRFSQEWPRILGRMAEWAAAGRLASRQSTRRRASA
jgi:hypothetical protein